MDPYKLIMLVDEDEIDNIINQKINLYGSIAEKIKPTQSQEQKREIAVGKNNDSAVK